MRRGPAARTRIDRLRAPPARLSLLAVVLVETIFFAALSPLLPELRRRARSLEGGVRAARRDVRARRRARRDPERARRDAAGRQGDGRSAGLGAARRDERAFGFVYELLAPRPAPGSGRASPARSAGPARSPGWSTRRRADRRGETIGIAMSAAIVGALLGPLLGGAAVAFRPRAHVRGVAALASLLAVCALRIPVAARAEERQPLRILLRRSARAARARRDVAARRCRALALRARSPSSARSSSTRSAGARSGVAATFAVSAPRRGGARARRRTVVRPPRPPGADPARPGREPRRSPCRSRGSRTAGSAVRRSSCSPASRSARSGRRRWRCSPTAGRRVGVGHGARVRPHELRLGAGQRRRLGRSAAGWPRPPAISSPTAVLAALCVAPFRVCSERFVASRLVTGPQAAPATETVDGDLEGLGRASGRRLLELTPRAARDPGALPRVRGERDPPDLARGRRGRRRDALGGLVQGGRARPHRRSCSQRSTAAAA